MLRVLKPGFYTTLQDNGRFGYRDMGVPISGAMDMNTVFRLNTLLENKKNASVLEITMTGPTLLFEKDTYIVLGGALLSPTLNNSPICNNKIYKINAGDIISYGRLEKGFRAYLAIKKGFKCTEILGSASQYYPITERKCIAEQQQIDYDEVKVFEPKISELKMYSLLDITAIELTKGPEFGVLDDRQLMQLFSKEFTVAKENNRMAYQLNECIEGNSATMLTSATQPGTVQLTPSGKLIILMKDGQTTGGYPRILQLTEQAISILAQKRTSDILNFKLV